METGYDIIFFWVARMMMLGDPLPRTRRRSRSSTSTAWSGPVPAPKMSKTNGNVVDPLEAIDEIGADALRFALIHGTTPGNDQKFSQEKLENARNFANKLWNAARFVLGARPASIPPDAPRRSPDPARLGPADRWLRSRIAATVAGVDGAMDEFAFGEATRLLYEATWNEFCDWGLELAKVRLADATPARRGPRGDLVDAGRGARHAAPPAPPVPALRDRGDLGGHARTPPTTRTC